MAVNGVCGGMRAAALVSMEIKKKRLLKNKHGKATNAAISLGGKLGVSSLRMRCFSLAWALADRVIVCGCVCVCVWRCIWRAHFWDAPERADL